MEDDVNIAHINVNKKLFEIDFKEIETVSILGEGGSSSIVFECIWKGKRCAFKCFKTRQLMSDQSKFDDFEKEVSILSSLSHPNIIQFFGACLYPPRVGIVMELCPKGEILEFVKNFKSKYSVPYPVHEKIQMMCEIVGALEYLHSRSIIHRDLKCENVLISRDNQSKLMDFGLSRLVDRISAAKTKRIGTSVYMAPEIVADDQSYTEKCDVFSFAILCYVLLTENSNPYGGKDDFRIEIKVSNNPNYRPDLKKLETLEGVSLEVLGWVIPLITRCWCHEAKDRLSCQEIREIIMEKEKMGEEETKHPLHPVEMKMGLVSNNSGVHRNDKLNLKEEEIIGVAETGSLKVEIGNLKTKLMEKEKEIEDLKEEVRFLKGRKM